MTHLCVPIFVSSVEQAIAGVSQAWRQGAEIVELRIDDFTDPASVAQLVKQSPLPCIVTCRSFSEGGLVEHSDAETMAAMNEAVSAGASYVDLEYETCRRAGPPQYSQSRLILSFHDFAGRPERLYNILTAINE